MGELKAAQAGAPVHAQRAPTADNICEEQLLHLTVSNLEYHQLTKGETTIKTLPGDFEDIFVTSNIRTRGSSQEWIGQASNTILRWMYDSSGFTGFELQAGPKQNWFFRKPVKYSVKNLFPDTWVADLKYDGWHRQCNVSISSPNIALPQKPAQDKPAQDDVSDDDTPSKPEPKQPGASRPAAKKSSQTVTERVSFFSKLFGGK